MIDRIPRRPAPQRMPVAAPDDPGLVLVDVTWGVIAPMTLAPGVVTVGELEVIEHLEAGGLLVDTRQPEYFAAGTIPGAVNIPHQEILARRDELQSDSAAVVFCNGPQCAATPRAVGELLVAGHPPGALRYYRGGIHDWVTLGLPLERPGRRRAGRAAAEA